MSTVPAPTDRIARRRLQVAQLRRDKKSIRDIARELGVGRSTVQRDIDAIEGDTPPAPDHIEGTPNMPVPRDTETAATPPTPAAGTPSQRPKTMAPMSLILAADAQLIDDLAVLTRTGDRPEVAARFAIGFLASVYRRAWQDGVYPPDATPRIGQYTLEPHRPASDDRSK
ncbi:helix-turn-helix domain-containing protein [Streptomyces sp. NPDC006339]|uniref:helix-turn-helix domain-containing protein n=1 Tax=Streptomyces sp. NPDC006339 TaxID=3156755 RepID=UPI0033A39B14